MSNFGEASSPNPFHFLPNSQGLSVEEMNINNAGHDYVDNRRTATAYRSTSALEVQNAGRDYHDNRNITYTRYSHNGSIHKNYSGNAIGGDVINGDVYGNLYHGICTSQALGYPNTPNVRYPAHTVGFVTQSSARARRIVSHNSGANRSAADTKGSPSSYPRHSGSNLAPHVPPSASDAHASRPPPHQRPSGSSTQGNAVPYGRNTQEQQRPQQTRHRRRSPQLPSQAGSKSWEDDTATTSSIYDTVEGDYSGHSHTVNNRRRNASHSQSEACGCSGCLEFARKIRGHLMAMGLPYPHSAYEFWAANCAESVKATEESAWEWQDFVTAVNCSLDGTHYAQ